MLIGIIHPLTLAYVWYHNKYIRITIINDDFQTLYSFYKITRVIVILVYSS